MTEQLHFSVSQRRLNTEQGFFFPISFNHICVFLLRNTGLKRGYFFQEGRVRGAGPVPAAPCTGDAVR